MPKKAAQPSSDDSQQLGLELGGDLQSTASVSKPQKAKKVAAYKQHPGRLERVRSRDWLESAIAAQNGDDECYRNCTNEITRIAFGVTPRRLYKLVGGKPGDRDTLPVEMQNKLILHELTIAPRLDLESIVGEDQADINGQILYVVRDQSQQTEQLLQRNSLYQNLVEKYRTAETLPAGNSNQESKSPPPQRKDTELSS
ncbi:hypothetical protein ACQ4M3_13150 [Leptolyngbya sp. AN03gr2]|uniref:hypothetical protein n=1 Tax=unclassified Leptolyngbya TaxID=2650499 RepID=UPI003D314517